ncbi:molybdopterin-guanine dinucleotide biosynthesis protein B [Stappia sp. ES.058]|uniref:molybdopterin-guanine dinucleotide biosynthesis protein B n=1 Tax=Stappia sp. ES.058 TaxID=1881061 RepID=UPI00087C8B46|nr:molybdopterin-guanine dinucleotide biosynthesis protein B [Stappia sp. ES.058]SDU04910.1 molybdopterin guanine dinucleotide biosynthesis accessory protein MobB [Stappia sp. ES.058]
MSATDTPVFGITGWKNSGKTTLVVRLVEEFTIRGFRVSTIKHAHHAFDVDREGTDSHRHRTAGASEVALVSGRRWALMHELRGDDEPALADILTRLSPCDLVLIEGYKREGHPKIEARRADARQQTPLAPDDPHILAIASDGRDPSTALPQFDIDDIPSIADFIAAHCGLEQTRKVPDAIL